MADHGWLRVNINSKCWNDGWIIPALDRLRVDLGATLYRVDIFGKSNWPDPDGSISPAALDAKRLAEVYHGDTARTGWAMMRYFNEHGIEPYLTASGDVPQHAGANCARVDQQRRPDQWWQQWDRPGRRAALP